MSGQHGGYRKPTHPAPVSGPAAQSRRTDGGPAHQAIQVQKDQDYGDRQTAVAAQQAAPLPQVTNPPPMPTPQGGPQGGAQAPQYAGGAFGAPTNRPDEPITHGVDIGPGGGPEALGMTPPPNAAQGTGAMTNLLQNLSVADNSGILSQLMVAARARNA